MIVADTNLITYLLVPGEFTSGAEQVFIGDGQWCAPLLWRSEFRNILALYMRRSLLSYDEALSTMRDAESLIDSREYEVSSVHVLGLARDSTCSAYDCEFVALARDLDVPLVTSDRRVLTDFPSIAVSIDAFST